MTCGIYSLVCDEICLYVGQSKDIEKRFKRHVSNIKRGKHIRKDLQEWIYEKSNLESLQYKVLETCDDNDETKNKLEMLWFTKLNPIFYGQKPTENSTWTHSVETKRKIGSAVSAKYIELMDSNIELILEKSNDDVTYFKDLVEILGTTGKSLRRYLNYKGITFVSPQSRIKRFLDNNSDEILEDYFTNGYTTRELANKYSVDQPQIIELFNRNRKTDPRFLDVVPRNRMDIVKSSVDN